MGIKCYYSQCTIELDGTNPLYPFCCQEHKDLYWKEEDEKNPELAKKRYKSLDEMRRRNQK